MNNIPLVVASSKKVRLQTNHAPKKKARDAKRRTFGDNK